MSLKNEEKDSHESKEISYVGYKKRIEIFNFQCLPIYKSTSMDMFDPFKHLDCNLKDGFQTKRSIALVKHFLKTGPQ